MTTTSQQPATHEERAWALAQAVQHEVANGAKVEAQSELAATVVTGSTPNHTAHLILTIFTFTLWSPMWLLALLTQHERRTVLAVDPWGRVHRTQGPRRN